MGERTIVVDDEVFAELQALAEPLVDDANSVLRRVLDLATDRGSVELVDNNGSDPEVKPTGSSARARRTRASKPKPKRKKQPDRAAKGSLLPESEYELPLLQALVELNGSAPTSEVVDRLGEKLDGRLTDVDCEPINSGEIRWRNRVQFVRLGLIKEGLMAKDSPRGVWEITEAGRERVSDAEAAS